MSGINIQGVFENNDNYKHHINKQTSEPESISNEYVENGGLSNQYFDWINAHSQSIQPAIKAVASQVQYIPHKDFIKALGRSIHSVKSRLPHLDQNAIVLVEENKSNKWVAELALKHYQFQGSNYYRLGTKKARDYVTYLHSNKSIQSTVKSKMLVLFDDASYSGKQICDHINGIAKQKIKPKAIVIIIPFMTNQAEKAIEGLKLHYKKNPEIIICDHEHLRSLSDIEKNSYKEITKMWYKGDIDKANKISLAWFQHKVANDQSFPAAIHNGSVYDEKGESKKGKHFSLVPKITEIYKKE